MPNQAFATQEDGPTGGFGEAPYGATKRCSGWVKKCQIECAGRTRTVPLGASVELPMGPRSA
eukprot:2253867-Pyramimonas_sp.AAC.1